jgi:hypothetical protein
MISLMYAIVVVLKRLSEVENEFPSSFCFFNELLSYNQNHRHSS